QPRNLRHFFRFHITQIKHHLQRLLRFLLPFRRQRNVVRIRPHRAVEMIFRYRVEDPPLRSQPPETASGRLGSLKSLHPRRRRIQKRHCHRPPRQPHRPANPFLHRFPIHRSTHLLASSRSARNHITQTVPVPNTRHPVWAPFGHTSPHPPRLILCPFKTTEHSSRIGSIDMEEITVMTELWRDIRYGLRLLWKSAGFTSVSLLALALGIGATTAIFSLLYSVLLAPLPYVDSDRIVMVWSHQKGERNGTSPSDLLDWQKQATVFDSLNGWTGEGFTISTPDWTEQVQASRVAPGWFDLLFSPKVILGRHFVADDTLPGNDKVVILNNKFWRDHFGSDPSVVGRKLRM